MLNNLSKRLSDIGVNISFTDKVVEKIADEGFDDTYGARPLRRAIVSNIEDKLSEKLLDNTFSESDTVVCDYRDDEYVFECQGNNSDTE